MFDVGWSEMLVIAVVAIVVIGPKDLPRVLRQMGRTTAKLRAMAGDFRRQFDEALKEAELDDVTNTLNSARSLNPMNEIRKHLSPIEEVGRDVRAGLDAALKPQPVPEPAATPVVAEPLKNGAAALPGEAEAAPPVTEAAAAMPPEAKKPVRKAAKPAASARAAKAAKPAAGAAANKPAATKAPAKAAAKASAAKAARPAAAKSVAPKAPAPAGRTRQAGAGKKKTGSAT